MDVFIRAPEIFAKKMPMGPDQGWVRGNTIYSGLIVEEKVQDTINLVEMTGISRTQEDRYAQKGASSGDTQFVHLILEGSTAGFEHFGGAGLHAVSPAESL